MTFFRDAALLTIQGTTTAAEHRRPMKWRPVYNRPKISLRRCNGLICAWRAEPPANLRPRPRQSRSRRIKIEVLLLIIQWSRVLVRKVWKTFIFFKVTVVKFWRVDMLFCLCGEKSGLMVMPFKSFYRSIGWFLFYLGVCSNRTAYQNHSISRAIWYTMTCRKSGLTLIIM